jgi:malonyl CoA-acyl carrier protein transacylase/phosphopantetheinyl transferase
MGDEPRPFYRSWPAEVFTFAAPSRAEMIERLQLLASLVRGASGLCLKDLAYTLNSGNQCDDCSYRLAFVATNVDEASQRVNSALERITQSDCRRIKDPRGIYFFASPSAAAGRLAFLFPGEGSQYAGMLSELCLHFPQVRAWFDLMDRAFADHPRGYTPSQFIFPLPGEKKDRQSSPDRLWHGDGAVEAVFTGSQAMLTLLHTLRIQPDAVLGHSAGDYSALFACGAFQIVGSFEFIQQARAFNSVYEEFAVQGGVPQGVLLAVNSANPSVIASVLAQAKRNLHLALDNCPHQVILCGTEDSTRVASEQLRSAGAVCEVLPFARAYHTPLFRPVSEKLYGLLKKMHVAVPSLPAYSCVTAEPYPPNPDEIRRLSAEQWSRPVRFREAIERMYQDGVRVFVEVGPNSKLTAFTEDTLRGRPIIAVASNIEGRSGIVQLQHLAAQLFATGIPIRLDEFYARREPRRISMDSAVSLKAAAVAGVPLALRLPTLRLPPRPATALSPSARVDPVRTDAAQSPFAATAAPVMQQAPDARNQVLESFFQNTMTMLEAEREVMTRYLAKREHYGATSPSDAPEKVQAHVPVPTSNRNLPFVRKIISLVPGREVKVHCDIDLEEDIFLTHHTLAGRISKLDSTLVALPVIPLTVSMEILAEVASLLVPGRVVVRMENLQGSRWLIVEQRFLDLEVVARCTRGADEVYVELTERVADETQTKHETRPAVAATVVFGNHYPQPPDSMPLALDGERATKWPSGRMYTGTGMFHGPLFQVVHSMDHTCKQGAEATFVAPSMQGFFRNGLGDQLIDPVTLDAMGQVVGYWVGDHFETGLSVFPFRLEKLEIFGPGLRAGERASCRLRVHDVDELWIRSDIEVLTKDSRPLFRMTGWEDRRLNSPRRFYDFRISPADVLLSDPWPVPLNVMPVGESFRCVAIHVLPENVFEAHGAIWLMVLAFMVLNRNERQVWLGLRGSGRRSIEWLLGRIAAKEAVRTFLRDTVGLQLCSTDVEIASTSLGAPEVKGEWTKSVSDVPTVSISHGGGLTIAVAGRSAGYSSVGADVELIGRISSEVEALVLSSPERELLASLNDFSRAEWATRLWCAKEAVGKALGNGLQGSYSGLQVQDIDVRNGSVRVTVPNGRTADVYEPSRPCVTAYTGTEGSYAFGTALV